jgi:predicted DNA binding CopG/RHH family protein
MPSIGKQFPVLASDEEAENEVATIDLSEYDLSGFRPLTFELRAKTAQLNMRLPASMLDAVKAKANAAGIPYTRYIRQLLERDLA